jgi:tRNA dimethylallyltransferase
VLPPLLVLVGPTAVGKTALSLQLAKQFNGEIVSADSRLLYLNLDIGTAKPTPVERAEVIHHLIDICQPDQTLTLGEYQRLAYHIIGDIQRRGRLPILVGGTGQYVKAVVEGWGIPEVPPQPALREALAMFGSDEVTRWLRALDPVAAERIDPRNVRRVIRALEVTLLSGRPISELQRKTPPPYTICTIGLTCGRETLYRRVDERVDGMMAAGLLDEVRWLREDGYPLDMPAMSALGYRQLNEHLDGKMTLAEAVERIKFETHRFVRQQYTWFRLDDPAVSWFDNCAGEAWPAVAQLVTTWMAIQVAKPIENEGTHGGDSYGGQ